MSHVEKNQPEGTPTWIDLGIPDLDQAMDFYRALFGWEYEVGPAEAGTTRSVCWTAAGSRRWR